MRVMAGGEAIRWDWVQGMAKACKLDWDNRELREQQGQQAWGVGVRVGATTPMPVCTAQATRKPD